MSYILTEKRSFDSKSDCFVICLDINCSESELAVNICNELIEIIDTKTLQTISEVKGLDEINSVLKYCPQNANQLFVCSLDSIKVFDLRQQSLKCVKRFTPFTESNVNFNHLLCFDANSDHNYLCAGTEVSDRDRNSYLLFWDMRRPAVVLGTYCESHTNDITDIAFHPNQRNVFASGGCDQLINVFDLNETEEEEALMATLNVETAVDRIHWTPNRQKCFICLTQEKSIQLWDFEEAVPEVNVSALSTDSGFDYPIDVLPNSDVICVGYKDHSIKMFDINSTDSLHSNERNDCLTGGHKKTVRTVVSNADKSVIYSGSEDSVVCVWSRLSTDSLFLKSQTKGKTKLKRNNVNNRSIPY